MKAYKRSATNAATNIANSSRFATLAAARARTSEIETIPSSASKQPKVKSNSAKTLP